MAIKVTVRKPDLPNIRNHPPALSLWRLFGWGGATTIALAVVAIISQTESGSKRLQQLASADMSRPVREVASTSPRATEPETGRLAAQVRELAADRERLTVRIATLEYDLDGITASIKQQSNQLASLRTANITPAATEAETQRLATQMRELTANREQLTARIDTLERNLVDTTGSIRQQSNQIASAHTADIPPAATEAETQRLATQVRELAADREWLIMRINTLERNLDATAGTIRQQSNQLASAHANTPAVVATVPSSAFAPPALTQPAMPAMPNIAVSRPVTRHVVAAAPIPARPVRVTAALAEKPAAEPPQANSEFGIDLGSASSIEALRIHWAMVKTNFGPLLVGLHPLASQHSNDQTGAVYRLVVGPLRNAADAALLCGRFPVTRNSCQAVKFEGTQLAEH